MSKKVRIFIDKEIDDCSQCAFGMLLYTFSGKVICSCYKLNHGIKSKKGKFPIPMDCPFRNKSLKGE